MFSIRRKLLAGGFALTMLATACGDDLATPDVVLPPATGDETITVNGGDIQLTSGLATFGSCDALLTHLQTEGAERVGAWGFNHGDYWGGPVMFDDVAMEEAEAMMDDDAMVEDASDSAESVTSTTQTSNESASSGADGLVEGEDFSGTNNQESGVDEPDYVKTDGQRILTMTNGQFTYVDANNGTPQVRGSIALGHNTQEMLVVGDRVYLFGTSYGEEFYPEVLGELKITGYSGQLHPLGPDHVLGIGQEATEQGWETGAKVTLFDVSDLSNPIDVATWTVDNSWSDAQWDWDAPENGANRF